MFRQSVPGPLNWGTRPATRKRAARLETCFLERRGERCKGWLLTSPTGPVRQSGIVCQLGTDCDETSKCALRFELLQAALLREIDQRHQLLFLGGAEKLFPLTEVEE